MCQTRLCSKKKFVDSLFLDERFIVQSFVHIEFHRSLRFQEKKRNNKKKRIDLRSQEVRRTLILQEESSCRVQPLRGDKVEGDHARVRNDLDASRGTTILEQRPSFFSHSHDVHAIAICFWSLENN